MSLNPEPFQILEHRGNELRPASLRIKIFVSKDECPTKLPRSFSRNQKGASMAEMEQASWRRRNPVAILCRHNGILASRQLTAATPRSAAMVQHLT
jgi:hypothetical protein